VSDVVGEKSLLGMGAAAILGGSIRVTEKSCYFYKRQQPGNMSRVDV